MSAWWQAAITVGCAAAMVVPARLIVTALLPRPIGDFDPDGLSVAGDSGGLGFGVLCWFGLALVITNARPTAWLWAHARGGIRERLARWFLGPRPALEPPPEGTAGATRD